jgi:hypothetical protein
MADPVTLGLAGASILASILSNYAAQKTSRSGKNIQRQRFTPQQVQNLDFLSNKGRNMIENPMQGFEPIKQNALNTFNQQVVPSLAERFTAHTGGGISSPSFASQLGQAGAGQANQLAAMGAQFGQNQQEIGRNLLGMGLTPQFENEYHPGGPTALSSAFSGAGQGFGALGGHYMNDFFGQQSQDRLLDQAKQWYAMMNPGAGQDPRVMNKTGIGQMGPLTQSNNVMGPMMQSGMPNNQGGFPGQTMGAYSQWPRQSSQAPNAMGNFPNTFLGQNMQNPYTFASQFRNGLGNMFNMQTPGINPNGGW